MKDIIINKIINSIKKYYNYDDIKLKEIRYGLESLYLSIFKIIVVIILSFFFKTTKELLLFFITYGLLRLVSFGAHAKRSIDCWIYSLLFFSLVPYLIKKIIIPFKITIFIILLSILLLSIYAPADTEKRPLINKKKRTVFKIVTIIISLIYSLIIILSKKIIIQNLLLFSLLIETILVLPITYKILGVSYNNYKKYKGKEDKK